MKRSVSVAAVSAVLGLMCAASAGAATLDMSLTVDNQFAVYLSSSDSALGSLVGVGNAWQTTYAFSDPLGPGRQYIHVIATNWTTDNGLWGSPGTPNGTGGNPDGFIGTFSISGNGYKFANGLTTLSTDTTDWRADPATPAGAPPWAPTAVPAWTAPIDAPQSYGVNGVGPWGSRGSISSGAEWIWSSSRQPQLRRIFDDHIVVGSRVIHVGHVALRLCGPRPGRLPCAQGHLDRRLRILPTLGKTPARRSFFAVIRAGPMQFSHGAGGLSARFLLRSGLPDPPSALPDNRNCLPDNVAVILLP